MPVSPTLPFDLWKLNPESYVFRLFKNDIVPTGETTLGQLVEADFPGYAPLTGHLFALDDSNVGNDLVVRKAMLTWIRTATAAAQTVRGFYLTYPVPDGVPALLVAKRLSADWTHSVKDSFLSLDLEVGIGKDVNQQITVDVGHDIFTGAGDPQMNKFRGNERRLLQAVKKKLDAITTRDAALSTRSTRSKKSPVAMFPGSMSALAQSFADVKARVVELLAM